jgi:hypothetical protein
VHSNLTLDDHQFGPDQCRNLQDEELYGVDVRDEQGTTLRLAVNVDDSITVVVFPNDASRPVAMTNCARVDLSRTDNDKYGHYEVSGTATIHCESVPTSPDEHAWKVDGTTSFDHCGHDF